MNIVNYLVGVAVAAYLHAHPDAFLHAGTVSTGLYVTLLIILALWIWGVVVLILNP